MAGNYGQLGLGFFLLGVLVGAATVASFLAWLCTGVVILMGDMNAVVSKGMAAWGWAHILGAVACGVLLGIAYVIEGP